MKVVIAPDSFKGSMTSAEACEAIAIGLKRVWPEATFIVVAMGDGGEGSMEVICQSCGGKRDTAIVCDPLGREVIAQYAIIESPQGRKAIVEMATASGLPLLSLEERNPLDASTYGTGELILAALSHSVDEIVVCLGGSATVDGGIGALAALGVRFFDIGGSLLTPSAVTLSTIASVDSSGLDPRLKNVKFTLACDVDNPLCGPEGAVRGYASQKGATALQVEFLEDAMEHWSSFLPPAVVALPGSGAAGGLAAGLCGFLHCEMRPGAELIAELVSLDAALEGADIAITGEGCVNWQTARGKAPLGVAKRARCPVIALTGVLGEGFAELSKHNIAVCWPIGNGPGLLEAAMRDGRQELSSAAERLARTIEIGRRMA